MSKETARVRAENLWNRFQEGARSIMQTEQRFRERVQKITKDRRSTVKLLKKRIEDTASETVVVLSDYKAKVTEAAESSGRKILENLQIASKSDIQHISEQIQQLQAQLAHLNQRPAPTAKPKK